MNLNCPKCHSEKIVKNGRTASNTQMYKCKNCNKYFTIQPLKKFPKTKLPFYFIINELRHFKDLKQVLGDDIKHGYLRNQFNQSYYFLEYHTEFPPKGSLTKSDSEKSGITRQRIYYWKKKYSKYLDDEEVVQEAKKFIAKRRKDVSKEYNPDKIPNDLCFVRESKKHCEILECLQDKIGRENLRKIIESDKIFGVYSELFDANQYKFVRKIRWEQNISK